MRKYEAIALNLFIWATILTAVGLTLILLSQDPTSALPGPGWFIIGVGLLLLAFFSLLGVAWARHLDQKPIQHIKRYRKG